MVLQVGYDDFGKVKNAELNFVDKTLFIQEVLDNKNIEVSVITRPRRFGKTFNLSTLHHFLASEVNQLKTAGMFDGLKIAQLDQGRYMQYQGRYPVIFISFKEIKADNYELAYSKLRTLMANIFNGYEYLENSDKLSNMDKQMLQRMLNKEANQAEIEGALYFLTSVLFKHYSIKPWLLIDEYDTPIQSGYLNGYYNEIVNLMHAILGAALKSNSFFDRAIITGILRIAKESLFSGLNNVKVFTLLQQQYSQHFGFDEEEVKELLRQSGLGNAEEAVKKWYNGYNFGGVMLYNPWSIVNYINDQILKPYWVNTSDNQLIKMLLIKSSIEFKEQFKFLLQDRVVEKQIDENMVFGDLINNQQAAWSLLLMSGYLKAVAAKVDERGKNICICAIPNWEVKILYCDMVEEWLGNGHGINWHQNFLTNLLDGDIKKFEENFGQILLRTISVYDLAHNPEAFYHGFMLGLAASLDQRKYEVNSNRESGLGRYDIVIIPKDINKIAVILEIKSIVPPKTTKKKLQIFYDTILTREAERALQQINNKQYTVELVQRGIMNIVKIGLAFSGKEYKIASEWG